MLTKLKKLVRSGLFAAFAVFTLPITLNIGVMAVNDINAAAVRDGLKKEARAKNLNVTAAGCRVGHFDSCGNGAQYLAVVFLSEVPGEGELEGCWLYLPEEYEKEYGHCIASPSDYECAAVKSASPGNYFLYDFDLRGH